MDAHRTGAGVRILAVEALVAAVAFAAAFRLPDGWADLALGVATSFVFALMVEVILLVRRGLELRRRRRFFGTELVREQIRLNCPDFELHVDVQRILADAGQGIVYQRPGHDVAHERPQPMTFTTAMAHLDVVALMAVATVLSGSQQLPTVLDSDTVELDQQDHSLIAAGLTSNHFTQAYLDRARPALFSFDDPTEAGVPVIRLHDEEGTLVTDEARTHFALVVRHAPDPVRHPGKRWFLLAGLQEHGTPAAGRYLADHWAELTREVDPRSDFVAVVSFHGTNWASPSLARLVVGPRADHDAAS